MNWLISNEPIIRLGCFLSLLIIMLVWEQRSPTRSPNRFLDQTYPNWKRRLTNIALSAFNTIVIRFLPALSAVSIAHYATQENLGLFNLLALPFWLSCVITFVFLDMCIYFQHRVFHSVPWLWRLHRVHHSDEHIDTTTAIRFHPIEIILSMAIKLTLVFLIGAPVEAVIVFEIVLNGGALFNHGNVSLPKQLDSLLRIIIVTPDMHRVHHSTHYEEMNHNFGFNFSFWDRLFNSYTAQPKDGHHDMLIGLPKLRGKPTQSLPKLLNQPWYRH